MSVIWGLPYLFIRVADRDLDPAVIVSGRTLIGALVLLPSRRGRALRPVLAGWRWLIAFAVVEMAVPWYLLTDAERQLPSALDRPARGDGAAGGRGDLRGRPARGPHDG